MTSRDADTSEAEDFGARCERIDLICRAIRPWLAEERRRRDEESMRILGQGREGLTGQYALPLDFSPLQDVLLQRFGDSPSVLPRALSCIDEWIRLSATWLRRDVFRLEEEALLPVISAEEAQGFYRNGRLPTEADAWKSALLRRLLSGKGAMPKPPPLSYSYPWYELMESDEPLECAACLIKLGEEHSENRYVGVDQGVWQIVETLSEGEYLIRHHHGAVARVWPNPDPRAQRFESVSHLIEVIEKGYDEPA